MIFESNNGIKVWANFKDPREITPARLAAELKLLTIGELIIAQSELAATSVVLGLLAAAQEGNSEEEFTELQEQIEHSKLLRACLCGELSERLNSTNGEEEQ